MSFSKNQRLVAGTLAGVILVGSLATVALPFAGAGFLLYLKWNAGYNRTGKVDDVSEHFLSDDR